ncbi:sensor histidine kinase [Pedobacter namyangjuensis]|uniref:sensor histidine kinase n=1 Tax=Pedobacter namyangjuensis TaxID=600626 RepID=UPI000DE36771|nr:HAMP domain-containing sensor histidine kinase [Pedobacter namyangjuensis]
MKSRSLWLITALMTLALLGVFVMQLYYLRESYNLNSRLFEQDVNQALTAVVNKVQKRNIASHITRKDFEGKEQREDALRSHTDSIVAFKVRFRESEAIRKFKQQQQVIDYLNAQDSTIRSMYMSPIIISEEEFKLYSGNSPSGNDLKIQVEDLTDRVSGERIGVRIKPLLPKPKRNLQIGGRLPDTIRYVALSPANMLPITIHVPSSDPDLVAKFKIEDAKAEKKYEIGLKSLYADTAVLYNDASLDLVRDVAQELTNKDIPLRKRIPRLEALDTLIRAELLSKNINLNYDFWLTPASNRKNIIYQKVVNADELAVDKNTFSQVIFSNDVAIKDPGMIYLRFPSVNSLIMSNMFVSMGSSIALLLVLIFIFAYTIYAIIRQKKITEMKTDFINNMTHEFKTPVATIMIASEALKDPEVVEDKSRISRLAGIIYDENIRLGNHIERVLSVARLEKKEIKLESNPVAVNDLINAVVDSMSLQLQKRNAHVALSLNAVDDIVIGDELHLSNVIYNLIDNANKYSTADPQITISTKSSLQKLIIEVADKGIGMTKDQTKRIFDQFYRVPTGNLHDVKGFGLGLNYVQDIVTQMNGTIKVHSEKDKGTTFEVILPFKRNN